MEQPHRSLSCPRRSEPANNNARGSADGAELGGLKRIGRFYYPHEASPLASASQPKRALVYVYKNTEDAEAGFTSREQKQATAEVRLSARIRPFPPHPRSQPSYCLGSGTLPETDQSAASRE